MESEIGIANTLKAERNRLIEDVLRIQKFINGDELSRKVDGVTINNAMPEDRKPYALKTIKQLKDRIEEIQYMLGNVYDSANDMSESKPGAFTKLLD